MLLQHIQKPKSTFTWSFLLLWSVFIWDYHLFYSTTSNNHRPSFLVHILYWCYSPTLLCQTTWTSFYLWIHHPQHHLLSIGLKIFVDTEMFLCIQTMNMPIESAWAIISPASPSMKSLWVIVFVPSTSLLSRGNGCSVLLQILPPPSPWTLSLMPASFLSIPSLLSRKRVLNSVLGDQNGSTNTAIEDLISSFLFWLGKMTLVIIAERIALALLVHAILWILILCLFLLLVMCLQLDNHSWNGLETWIWIYLEIGR